jgi:Fic family protein
LEQHPDLNDRQRELIQYCLKHPSCRFTVREHEGKYHVTYNTAKADLHRLEALGFLTKVKRGKEWNFRPASELIKRLRQKGA